MIKECATSSPAANIFQMWVKLIALKIEKSINIVYTKLILYRKMSSYHQHYVLYSWRWKILKKISFMWLWI